MKTKTVSILLGIIIVAKLFLTFIQQGRISLDGDMCSIIIPSESYKPVMKDPFAVNVLLNNKIYASPNRSFAHWTMYSYFRTVPFFLQLFTNKIDSIYASAALAKTLIQAFFIFLLASLAGNTNNIRSLDFLIPAAVISFLFQIYDLNSVLGLIQSSITYTFFYSLPLCLILYLFHSLYFLEKNGGWKNAGIFRKSILILLPVFLSLNGPLNTGVAIIACPLILLYLIWKNRKQMYNSEGNLQLKQTYQLVPKSVRIVFSIFIFFSMYSLYIGKNNAESLNHTLSLPERYHRMIEVLPEFFTGNIAMPILILFPVISLFFTDNFIHKNDFIPAKNIALGIFIFTLVYVALLPFGGYRVYRPTILRTDTFTPVLVCLFYLAGRTSYELIQSNSGWKKNLSIVWTIAFTVYFGMWDISLYKQNRYERAALQTLAKSTEKMVELKTDCTVMSWVPLTDYRESELNCKLLKYWGAIQTPDFYFQKPDSPDKLK
ncbi:MAG TPA: hypothetical protein PKL85_01470 [Bacteroidia bacterium]|nr:hypothetical protein [Bacteroidia bacterium]